NGFCSSMVTVRSSAWIIERWRGIGWLARLNRPCAIGVRGFTVIGTIFESDRTDSEAHGLRLAVAGVIVAPAPGLERRRETVLCVRPAGVSAGQLLSGSATGRRARDQQRRH